MKRRLSKIVLVSEDKDFCQVMHETLSEIEGENVLIDQTALAVESAQHYEASQTTAQRLVLLNELGVALGATRKVAEVFKIAAARTNQIVGGDRASLTLLNEKSDTLELYSLDGLKAIPIDIQWPLEETIFGMAIQEQRVINLPDLQACAKPGTGLMMQHGLQSCLIAPLVANGKVLGTLNVVSKQLNAFARRDESLLLQIASTLATTLENRRLFQETEAALKETAVLLAETERLYRASRRINEATNLQAIVAAVAEAGPVASINRAVLEIVERDAAGQIEALKVVANWHSGIGLPPTPVGTRFPTAQFPDFKQHLGDEPIFYDDLQRDQPLGAAEIVTIKQQNTWAAVVLPLWVGSRQVGLLVLAAEEAYQFTATERQGYIALAKQMAIAVENHYLLEQTQTSLARTEALFQITRSLISPAGLPDLLQMVVDSVMEVLPAHRASLCTVDLEKRQIIYDVQTNLQSSFESFNQMWEGLAGWVIRERKPALSPKDRLDLRESPRVQQTRAEEHVGSVIAVPLSYQDRILGAIVALNDLDEPDFTEDDVRLMMTIASQAAVAIENRALFEQTQQRAIELEELTKFLDSILESMPTPLFVKDAETLQLVRWNRANEELMGLSQQEVMSKTVYDFCSKDEADLCTANDREVLARGELVDFSEVPLHTASGELRFLHTRQVPILGRDNKPKYLLGISEDITERKRAEKELRRYRTHLEELVAERTIELVKANEQLQQEIADRQRAENAVKEYSERLEEMVAARTQALRDAQEQLVRREKLAVLGELAGGVAHELRNPLGVICNAVYFLRMILSEADETTREYLDIISDRVHNAEKTVADLLNFARSGPVKKNKTLLSELVAQVLAQHPPPKDVTVVTDIAADLPAVLVDPDQIDQVLTNLIVNAYQAMPTGGKLTLWAKTELKQVRLFITDTGPGISTETMSKIFEPLFTTKVHGFGLGLAVVKNLIEVNGGKIEVDSQEGQGSTFMVTLPNL